MTNQPATANEVDLTSADEQARQLITSLQRVIKLLTGWRVWQSDEGALYATRQQTLSDAEIDAGLSSTIAADTADDLVDRLRDELDKSAKLQARAGF